MLRRLYHEQPESFAFTPANQEWAEGQITKFPEGRQASAVIPLLWRAQEQEGWVSKPAIEAIADMLGMAYIRVLEVTSFYFMFQMKPVGSLAHIQICGTLSCMICGAEDLIAVCREKIAANPHELSADGRFSWEEVECLGACTNAPMAQIGKDYFEDLTAEGFAAMLDDLAAGNLPKPGPQNGRYSCEPITGLTSLKEYDSGLTQFNASAQRAADLGDTIKRIDGTEVPILTPWVGKDGKVAGREAEGKPPAPAPTPKPAVKQAEEAKAAAAKSGEAKKPAQAKAAAKSDVTDDLKLLKGVGPKLEEKLRANGVTSLAQIAAWGAAQIEDMDDRLSFKGRIARDGWVDQAKLFIAAAKAKVSKPVAKDDGDED